jgi:F420-dependent oxidoreductase-like protein
VKGIRIGLGCGDNGRESVDALVAKVKDAEAAGFQAAWIPSFFQFDCLTWAALAGRETERIEVGTAVAVTHSRHPYYMAQQAASTNAACGGRFVLGLGPSHQLVIEGMLGLSYAKPGRHVREYLEVVTALSEHGKVEHAGDVYRVNATLQVEGGRPFPTLIGGLGPMMRKLAGRLAGGSVTWMTGPKTLGGVIVPEVGAAAADAGRPAPRIVSGFPIVLTNEVDSARKLAGKLFAMYGTLPSYRAMLDEEGFEGPADVALIGDEATLEKAIARLAEAGVTDLNANVMPDGKDREGSMQRTTEFLADLARRTS